MTEVLGNRKHGSTANDSLTLGTDKTSIHLRYVISCVEQIVQKKIKNDRRIVNHAELRSRPRTKP
jgi:hypothetical protein